MQRQAFSRVYRTYCAVCVQVHLLCCKKYIQFQAEPQLGQGGQLVQVVVGGGGIRTLKFTRRECLIRVSFEQLRGSEPRPLDLLETCSEKRTKNSEVIYNFHNNTVFRLHVHVSQSAHRATNAWATSKCELQLFIPSLFEHFPLGTFTMHQDSAFYNSAITKPVVCARIVVEMGSHLTKRVPVQSHNSFLDQRSRKVIV